MTTKLVEWASGHRQPTKIELSKAEAENLSNDGAIWVTSPWKPSYLGYIGLMLDTYLNAIKHRSEEGGISWKNNSSIAADGHGISPLKVEAEMTAVAVPSDERREGPAVAVEFAARAHPWRHRAMPLRRRCLE